MDLNKFTDKKGKFDSLYTILVYNTKVSDFISFLYEKLDSINNISNQFKKYLNNIIFSFKEFIESKYKKDNIINELFLVSKEINNFKLKNSDIKELKEFDIKNILFLNGESFKIEYIKDLLYNYNYRYVININNKKLIYYKLTKTKKSNK